ncbi:alpha/beta hydrolase-fold protein, partial [Klebsiella pneumoniae]|uniref:alpha/beta hydrolase-fold protein n=1 Tax=Klebsiella pneumoniae TaxID=573 RepID=UPI0038533B53
PLIIVMPNAGRSFYVDAINGFPYQTAIGQELADLVEGYFPTKLPWCTAGLSMGGYGAFRLALSYPDRFISAVSHSGALTGFSSAPNKELERLWGP